MQQKEMADIAVLLTELEKKQSRLLQCEEMLLQANKALDLGVSVLVAATQAMWDEICGDKPKPDEMGNPAIQPTKVVPPPSSSNLAQSVEE